MRQSRHVYTLVITTEHGTKVTREALTSLLSNWDADVKILHVDSVALPAPRQSDAKGDDNG